MKNSPLEKSDRYLIGARGASAKSLPRSFPACAPLSASSGRRNHFPDASRKRANKTLRSPLGSRYRGLTEPRRIKRKSWPLGLVIDGRFRETDRPLPRSLGNRRLRGYSPTLHDAHYHFEVRCRGKPIDRKSCSRPFRRERRWFNCLNAYTVVSARYNM